MFLIEAISATLFCHIVNGAIHKGNEIYGTAIIKRSSKHLPIGSVWNSKDNISSYEI